MTTISVTLRNSYTAWEQHFEVRDQNSGRTVLNQLMAPEEDAGVDLSTGASEKFGDIIYRKKEGEEWSEWTAKRFIQDGDTVDLK